MNASEALDDLVESVADGDDIDWTALEANADPDILRLLAMVKTVAGVAQVHRTPLEEEETGPVPSALPGGAAVPLGELGRWGHLQLVRKVGEGAYGEVFHARDTWLDHPVALKLLRPELTDRVAPTRLLDEARVLVKVRHPNVVAVHGADLQQGRVGFWMEFVQGQRLDELVAFQGLLSAEEAAAVGQELCSALAAVHDAGLVHRDVKAQNVIREPKGRVVLMDFGAGQLVADVVGGAGAGTPLYLAPEMFDDAPASAQTDIYALGVLLYYLVTAGYPVPARSIEELKQAHAARRQRPLLVARPGLPRGFVNVVERMLEADPAERYQTALEALAGLKRFAAPASLLKSLVRWAIVLGLSAAAVTLLGLINTASFNVILGRGTAFRDDLSLLSWFRWGISSTFPVVFYTGLSALLLTLGVVALRLLRKFAAPVDRALIALRRKCVEWLSERGLDEPALALLCVSAMGALALTTLAWLYWDYGAAIVTSNFFVNRGSPSQFAALEPAHESRVDTYGRLLDLLLLLHGLVCVRILTWARRVNAVIPSATKLAALMVPVVAMVLWQLPYRLVYQNTFERVDVGGTRCYQLGRNESDLLLHCPDVPAPRNRVVAANDPLLHRRGVVESMFVPANQSRPSR